MSLAYEVDGPLWRVKVWNEHDLCVLDMYFPTEAKAREYVYERERRQKLEDQVDLYRAELLAMEKIACHS